MFDLNALVSKKKSANQLMVESANLAMGMPVDERKEVIVLCNENIQKYECRMKEIAKKDFSQCSDKENEEYMSLSFSAARYDAIRIGMTLPEEVIKDVQREFREQAEME